MRRQTLSNPTFLSKTGKLVDAVAEISSIEEKESSRRKALLSSTTKLIILMFSVAIIHLWATTQPIEEVTRSTHKYDKYDNRKDLLRGLLRENGHDVNEERVHSSPSATASTNGEDNLSYEQKRRFEVIASVSKHDSIGNSTKSSTKLLRSGIKRIPNFQNNSDAKVRPSSDLWNLAVVASVPRGEVGVGGKVSSRLDSYGKKRIGPSRHDGKAFKAGEAGCPQTPTYEKLPGGRLVQGDSRLKRIHFVHPPKSGGTTFGQVVIAVACKINAKYEKSLDCCVDPRDWCGENCEPIPDCSAIYGCGLCHCHHIPRLHRMKDATLSVTIIRHPMTRYISGFFYRAHSPNWDRFGLRPGYFSRDPTYPFKFSFDDYLQMPEYKNILVKMFAKDKFPYFNASLNIVDLQLAKDRLSKFLVVGINEAYDASVQLLLSLTGVTTLRDDQIHLPPAMTSTYAEDYEAFKKRAKSETALRDKIQAANNLDIELYQWAVGIFCKKLQGRQLLSYDKIGLCYSAI